MSLSVVTMPAALWELSPFEEYARGESWNLALNTTLSVAQQPAVTQPLAWLWTPLLKSQPVATSPAANRGALACSHAAGSQRGQL